MTEKELFLTALLGCARHELYVNAPKLTYEQECALAEMQHRRQNGEPVQYIVGFTEFMGLKFYVDPRVLIPRPETEFLVEMALADVKRTPPNPLFQQRGGITNEGFLDSPSLRKRGQGGVPESEFRILDLGTGSGSIAVSMAKFILESQVTAIDVSEDALDVAQSNAELNGVEDRIRFVAADMRKILQESLQSPGFFDMIMANPPYISTDQYKQLPEDVLKEPRLALDGGEDGLDFYRAIVAGAKGFLKPGGRVYCEIGEDQKEAIQKLVEGSGMYQKFEAFKDYAGKDRVVRFTA